MYNDIIQFLKNKLTNSVAINIDESVPYQFSYSGEITDLGIINLDGYESNLYRQVISIDLEDDSFNDYSLGYSVWRVPTIKIIITDGEGNFYNQSAAQNGGTILNSFYIGSDTFYINTTGITWPEGKSYSAYITFDFFYD